LFFDRVAVCAAGELDRSGKGEAMDPRRLVSGWSRAALLIGTLWFVLTGVGVIADYAGTRPGRVDRHAMFGGHAIALLLLFLTPAVGVVVLLLTGGAVVRCLRSGGAVVGLAPAVTGVGLVVGAFSLAFWAFVQ
jgi:hypothetical protein